MNSDKNKKLPGENEHQNKYSQAIRDAAQKGLDSFQNWFNKAEDMHEAVTRGFWDFSLHILTPKVCEQITDPEEKVALEIGYGGARILNAACGYFKEVIGIDIHQEQEIVDEFLKGLGKTNFKLIRTKGTSIDIDSESIDFIYSFIVLQHLPSFDVFLNYIKETYRCLKKGGIAQLYFGSFRKLGCRDRMRYLREGFCEIPNAPVNYTSLVVSVAKAKKISKALGFTVIDSGRSYKSVPDGYLNTIGGQDYITLLKK